MSNNDNWDCKISSVRIDEKGRQFPIFYKVIADFTFNKHNYRVVRYEDGLVDMWNEDGSRVPLEFIANSHMTELKDVLTKEERSAVMEYYGRWAILRDSSPSFRDIWNL